MSNGTPAKPPADELAKDLKASLAKRRPRTWKPILAAIVLCSLAMAAMVYWLLPVKQTPPLQVIALDDVFTPDEKPSVRAQLLAPSSDEPAPRMRGHDVVFDDQMNRKIQVLSNDKGQAVAEWPLENTPVAAFFAQYIDAGRRQGSLKESGRLFIWPKDASILFVDADETLLADELDDKAPEALNKAAEDGWRIVYLALGKPKPHDFRKVHGWLDEQAKLPKGPILGRVHLQAQDSIDAGRREVLQGMKNRFKGPMLAIVKSADAADSCKDLGVRAIRIGEAATPTWGEVAVK